MEKRSVWDEANAPRTGASRRCPICDRITDEALCPEHGMATLLVNPPDANVSKLEIGSLLGGRYVVQRVIGKGGYGAVFEARHTGTGQGVAVKTLAPGLEADETALKRFFQEARVTSGLRHPNTIRVFDFGQDDNGLIYLAMELLTGVTLKQELKKRQQDDRVFTEAEAIAIGVAITKSLGEAHLAGLVHRDLKPDNVFLHQVEGDDPVVKVLDFGIVKLANSSLTLGSDSGIPGTPAFMSPEQVIKRTEIDGRSDLYSLGVLLYNLVTGTVPYKGRDVMQTLYMHIHDPIPDVKATAKTPISDKFAAVITAAMAKEADQRPKDAKQMRARLLECAGDAAGGLTSSTVSDSIRVPVEEMAEEPTVQETTPSQRSLPSAAFSNELERMQAPAPAKNAPIVLWAILAMIMLIVGVLGTFVWLRLTEPEQIIEVKPLPIEPLPAREPAPTREVGREVEREVDSDVRGEGVAEDPGSGPAEKKIIKKRPPPKRVKKPEKPDNRPENKENDVLDEKI